MPVVQCTWGRKQRGDGCALEVEVTNSIKLSFLPSVFCFGGCNPEWRERIVINFIDLDATLDLSDPFGQLLSVHWLYIFLWSLSGGASNSWIHLGG